jgi:SNF2 family DNA or RNA helicase
LEGDHKKVYKAMKDLAIIQLNELEDGLSIFSPQARSGVEAALRCEQIAMGFVGGVPEPLVERLSKILSKHAEAIPGRPREVIFPGSAKMIWVQENLDTLFKTGKRPVVYSRFNAPLHWLYAHHVGQGKLVGFLHGGISSKDKGQIVADFQDSKFDLLLCQVLIAEGWNAHNSQDCIFLGRDWSPAVNFQAEDRLHRIGQKGTVNIQIPIVRGTIEVAIHKRLMAKDADAQQALRTVTIAQLKEAL